MESNRDSVENPFEGLPSYPRSSDDRWDDGDEPDWFASTAEKIAENWQRIAIIAAVVSSWTAFVSGMPMCCGPFAYLFILGIVVITFPILIFAGAVSQR